MSKPIALYQDKNYFSKAKLFKLGWLDQVNYDSYVRLVKVRIVMLLRLD